MSKVTPDPWSVPTPLTRLLKRRMEEEGWQLRDVCRPPDGTRKGAPARSTMSKHLQDGYWLQTMPRPQTREELATAVRVHVDEITDAAFRSLAANQENYELDVASARHGHRADSVTITTSERPVGLGLDDAAADLTEDDIEDIRALIRAKRERRGLT